MLRTFLLSTAALLAGCATTPPTIATADIQPPVALAAAMFPETGSAAERTQAALDRIERIEPQVNAVIAVEPSAMDEARALDRSAARGSLYGMPIIVKDNIETKGGLPTTAGSPALKDNVTGRDAPMVARLRQAGAVIVAKANLSEWANFRDGDSISGWSAVGGQTRNPHALDRNACGSSTGSGVVVASGMVPAAIGTETNGSISCPASVNGIVGFKPTVGLVSRTYVVPISHSQDTPGPMTRTVRDAARVLTAMAGTDPLDPATREADARKSDYAATLSDNALRGKRLGVMRFAAGFGTDAAFEQALQTLRAEGAILVDIDKFEGRGQIGSESYKVLLSEFKADLNTYLASTPPTVRTRTLADLIAFNNANAAAEMPLFGQDIFEGSEKTKGLDDPEYKKARATSFRLAGPEGIDRMLKEHNVVALVGPTVAAAWLIDSVHGDQYPGGGGGGLAAVAGYPHLTVPMGAVRGLPVGLSFIGPKWADALILSLGFDYEQASQQRLAPRFLRSIEETPEVRRAFEPQLR
jgi:amidase